MKDHKIGKIKEIRFLRDKVTKDFQGRAFVEFYEEKDARDALRMDCGVFMNQKIYVKLAS